MKISFIKFKEDKNRYKIAKMMGMDVFEVNTPEDIDMQIEELKNQNYKTIFIPNNLASFSENLINKYKNSNNLNIIITPTLNDDNKQDFN